MAIQKINEPVANVLMNSMRSMGYTFEAAIADIVDNSISAKAERIDIKFPVDPGHIYVAICDDGSGMDSDELFDAMKYGSEKKKNGRSTDDIGRYGLGLKSASLSQCRKLTVISKKDGRYSAYSWDLDVIEKEEEWLVLEYSDNEITELVFYDYLDNKNSGTVVIWENFDFLEKNTGDVYLGLAKLEEPLSHHLELVFHRFMSRKDDKKVDIWIDNYKLVPLDPFLENHKKTNIRRKINIAVEDSNGIERTVVAQPFILPFQKDMSKEDKVLVGGTEDYRTKQGFYIYRNERLIIWGTWFGRHKDELTKHARIRVDIPNTLDDIWCLDVKKQSASIPSSIKRQLTRAVDEAMDIAMKVQTYRGTTANKDKNPIWNRIIDEHNECYRYEINRDSKIFELIKNDVDDTTWNKIEMVLEEIESTIPFQQIYIDKSQNKITDSPVEESERVEEIRTKAKMLLNITKSVNPDISDKDAIENIFSSEPFNKFSEIKDEMLKGYCA